MDPDDVFDRLDTRWFYSSVFTPPSPELHLPLSTYPVDADDGNRQATPPGCPKVHHKVWSWLINSSEASDTVENAVALASETKLVEEPEQSSLIAMVMAETQRPHSPPPPPWTPPVPKPKSKDVEVRKKPRNRKKVKSVKNELMERRRNDLARMDHDYVRRFECCYLNGADQLYRSLLTRQAAFAV